MALISSMTVTRTTLARKAAQQHGVTRRGQERDRRSITLRPATEADRALSNALTGNGMESRSQMIVAGKTRKEKEVLL